jgi:hypothetical protein
MYNMWTPELATEQRIPLVCIFLGLGILSEHLPVHFFKKYPPNTLMPKTTFGVIGDRVGKHFR